MSVENQIKKLNINATNQCISSLSEYIEAVKEIVEKCNPESNEGTTTQDYKNANILVFRGHSRTDYKLIPFIGRIKNYSTDLEKQIFLEFKRQYHRYTQEKPRNDMEVLFLAQHYGLPTRLLDWTYNPLVALFFACNAHNEGKDLDDGRVYFKVLKNKFHDNTEDNEGEKMPETIDEIIKYTKHTPVIPDYTDIRYLNQQSSFFICDPTKEEEGVYITIEKKAKKKILKDLADVCGIDKKFIYPGLEELSQSIKAKYLSK